MSLRRRITAAVAVAVAAVAILIGAVSYLSAHAKLYGEVRTELNDREQAQRHYAGDGDFQHRLPTTAGDGQNPSGVFGPHVPPNPAFGGAGGQFQIVSKSGTVARVLGTNVPTAKLPVTAQVKAVAAGKAGRFFFSAHVDGHHLEILTVPRANGAVEIALPLDDDDSVLSSLLITYGLIAAGGVLLAMVIGLLIARGAVAPVRRFTQETEEVIASLSHPRRLEEGGPAELHALALYFNRTLDALEKSVLAQQHLIADASHELRTPMAALRSNIQIFLQADRLPPEDRVELQEAIIAEMDDLTQLVSDVLELARGAAPTDHKEAVELDGLVRDAVGRTQRRAPGLRFALDIEPTTIVASPDSVGRAVMNVVDNARKWSEPDGVVEVALRGGVLTVRDHGPGFREADLEKVFERFYRADDARRMPGSGLGLAIVKQAAEANGGQAVAANAAGGGALVTVRFGAAVNKVLSTADGAATFAP